METNRPFELKPIADLRLRGEPPASGLVRVAVARGPEVLWSKSLIWSATEGAWISLAAHGENASWSAENPDQVLPF
ncbi:MAG: hypothetical protein AAGA56_10365 [Myxococcota bacterium]